MAVHFWTTILVGVTGFDWEAELLGACRGAIARQTWQRFNCRSTVSSRRLMR